MLPRVFATRYVSPLREGGSLPGIVEADDLGTYVMKFRGAGQGLKVLVAEVIVGELARRLDLRVPDLRGIELHAAIGRYEPDEEVQDLLTASVGLNLGIDFLPGSFSFDAGYTPDPNEAARILWLDAFAANVDRSWRNPNLLIWHRELWCIDHGASLYFHHSWPSGRRRPQRFALQPYDTSDHVFVSFADRTAEMDPALAELVTPDLIDDVLALVPDEWLEPVPGLDTPKQVRSAYRDHLLARVAAPRRWLPVRSAA